VPPVVNGIADPAGYLGIAHLAGRRARCRPGLIQSVSQVLWSGLSAWVELSGLAPALCLKPLLPQPISI
jgi:hypothetical protein